MPLVGVRWDVMALFFEAAMTFPISTEPEVDFFPVGFCVSMGFRL